MATTAKQITAVNDNVIDLSVVDYVVSFDLFNQKMRPLVKADQRRNGLLWRRTTHAGNALSNLYDFMDPRLLIPMRTLDDNQEMTSETYVREQSRHKAWESEMRNVQDPRRVLGTHQQDLLTQEEYDAQRKPLPIDHDEMPVVMNEEEVVAMHNSVLMNTSKGVTDADRVPSNEKLQNRVRSFYHSSVRRGCDNENGCAAAELNKRHAQMMEEHSDSYKSLDQTNGVVSPETAVPEPPFGDQTLVKVRGLSIAHVPKERVAFEPGEEADCTLSPNDSGASLSTEETHVSSTTRDHKHVLSQTDLDGIDATAILGRFAEDQQIGFIDGDRGSSMDTGDAAFERPIIENDEDIERSTHQYTAEELDILGTGTVLTEYDSTGTGSSMQTRNAQARMPFSYQKNFDTQGSDFAGILQHTYSRSQEECSNDVFAWFIATLSTGRQSGFVPQSVNNSIRRIELPAVPRAVEEACMRQRLQHESECSNAIQCQGYKISSRYGSGFVMVSLKSAVTTLGVSEVVYNAMKSDICILCRRYIVSLGVTSAKTSAIKNAPANYSVSTWVNIVDMPHEYIKEDCDFPTSNGFDGIWGPIVRHNIHAYELGVMNIAGHPPVACLRQLFRMPTLDGVVNFQEGSRGSSLCL